MDDFRLKVFTTVAKTGSFTKTATMLYVSQPAISKNINELEREFSATLFERKASRLELTNAGLALLPYAERITEDFRQMRYAMAQLSSKVSGELHIGASTTIAQYFLPRILATYHQRFPEVKISMLSGNSEQIENALTDHTVDIGFVENTGRHTGLSYKPIVKDELVLVASPTQPLGRRDEIRRSELVQIPLVLREHGSGTLQVIERQLATAGLRLSDMNIVMQLGSTEAIKTYIAGSNTAAIVSVIAVADELATGKLHVTEITGLSFERDFSLVLRNGEQDALRSGFIEFVNSSL